MPCSITLPRILTSLPFWDGCRRHGRSATWYSRVSPPMAPPSSLSRSARSLATWHISFAPSLSFRSSPKASSAPWRPNAAAWPTPSPSGPGVARRPKRRRRAAWPAKVSRGKRRFVACARDAFCWSNVVASPASASNGCPSLGACLSDAHGVTSWSTSLPCLTGGAARRGPSISGRSCVTGSSGAHGLVTP
jgi:hypothetical protein